LLFLVYQFIHHKKIFTGNQQRTQTSLPMNAWDNKAVHIVQEETLFGLACHSGNPDFVIIYLKK